MNQHVGTIALKHSLAMLLMMSLEDENHQFQNIAYIQKYSHDGLPRPTSGGEAKWMRDLMPLIDPEIYTQMNRLLQGTTAVPGGFVNEALFLQTAANIRSILRGLSEAYDSNYKHHDETGTADGRGMLNFWDPDCYPHTSVWRIREALGALLA
ncbi:MAG: hypothetical protein ABI811_07860 [Acidobacteriota bacterium]